MQGKKDDEQLPQNNESRELWLSIGSGANDSDEPSEKDNSGSDSEDKE